MCDEERFWPQDFMQCLPFPEYAHPEGSLNIANYLAEDLIKPDLGPKSYIATGRYTPIPRPYPTSACCHNSNTKLAVHLTRLCT